MQDHAATDMLRWIFYFAVVVGLSVSAANAQSARYERRIANACEGMGLNPSEAPFVYCEMSLRENVASELRAQGAAVARRVCVRAGYRVGSASFANCVLDREENVERPAAIVGEGGEPFRSYQRGDEMTSVHRACAQIGLVPGSQQYATCVGNLDMTIDDADRVGTD